MNSFQPFSRAEYEPDELFATNARARAAKAQGRSVINCSVGEPKGEDGRLVQFSSVDQAQRVIREEFLKFEYGYGPIGGRTDYRNAIRALLFLPPDIPVAMYATGTGTASLALNLRTLSRGYTIIAPKPGWINDAPIIREAGLNIESVPYLDDKGNPTIEPILEKLHSTTGRCAVLSQISGQNPTGKDRPLKQWEELADFAKHRPFMMQFDVSYAGLAKDPEKDVEPLNIFAKTGLPFSISYCAGKNHAMPGFGSAMACTVVRDETERGEIEELYASIARGIPASGIAMPQRTIAYVQEERQDTWMQDLKDFRETVKEKREELMQRLPFTFTKPLTGKGMFAELKSLHSDDIHRLEEQDIFIPPLSKRINISAIPFNEIERFADAIKAVCR
jgi:aspartate/tyrosine/aromatic aminotransferase